MPGVTLPAVVGLGLPAIVIALPCALHPRAANEPSCGEPDRLRSNIEERREKSALAVTRKLRDVETLPKADATVLPGLECAFRLIATTCSD